MLYHEKELYDYNAKAVMHPDIAELDLEEGKWFRCKHCTTSRDPHDKSKFTCKPFGAPEIAKVNCFS